MRLKEVRPVMAGEVVLYEEAAGDEYRNIFLREIRDIPSAMLEREIVVIGASLQGEMLEVELKKE